MIYSALHSRQGKENGGVKEGAKISISVNPPPALPHHRKKSYNDSLSYNDDEDEFDEDSEENEVSEQFILSLESSNLIFENVNSCLYRAFNPEWESGLYSYRLAKA